MVSSSLEYGGLVRAEATNAAENDWPVLSENEVVISEADTNAEMVPVRL